MPTPVSPCHGDLDTGAAYCAYYEGVERDILSNRAVAGAVFVLPIVAIVASGNFNVGLGWRTAVWAASFATIGFGCLVNALRCGRVHCYLTGPFFLIVAAVTLLYGLGIIHLGASGWSTIAVIALAGGVLLCCLPEALFGKYLRRHE
jgi:hypothetical protein